MLSILYNTTYLLTTYVAAFSGTRSKDKYIDFMQYFQNTVQLRINVNKIQETQYIYRKESFRQKVIQYR